MIPEHRGKKVGWYATGKLSYPDLDDIRGRIRHVSKRSLERAKGDGVSFCRRRK